MHPRVGRSVVKFIFDVAVTPMVVSMRKLITEVPSSSRKRKSGVIRHFEMERSQNFIKKEPELLAKDSERLCIK